MTHEYKGKTFKVSIEPADYMGMPWEEEDGHGPVSEWTRRDKRPGEWVLCSDRTMRRFYDFSEAMKIAKRDGWYAEPYGTGSKGERAFRAVKADFDWLRRVCEGDVYAATVYVVLLDDDGEETDYADSLGGVWHDTYDGKYTEEVVNELAEECLWRFNKDQEDEFIDRRFADAMACGL